MNTVALDPKISEFETEEEAARYDQWFRAKVQEAITSPHPVIPHDEVVRRMQERLKLLQQPKSL